MTQTNCAGEEDAGDEIIEALPGDLRRIAEVAGPEAAVRIARAFRGELLYVPGLDEMTRRARDTIIRRDYARGESAKSLSRKHRLSERHIRNIISQPSKGELPDELLDLLQKDY